jgi:mannose-6-phosphate isomerase-like protein (cupin superfamily)
VALARRRVLKPSLAGHHALRTGGRLTQIGYPAAARYPSRSRGSPDALQAEGEPSHDHHRPGAAHSRRLSPPRTGSHPGQRADWRRRRRRLHDPPATSGPPLHVHAASDETFFVLSGVLLVHADGQVATIPEGGLVHVSRGMPHTFATTPGSPARFLVLHTPGGSGESRIAAADAVQEHGDPLRATTPSAWRPVPGRLGPRGAMMPGRGHMRQAPGRQARPLMELPPGAHVADVSTGRVPSPCLREQLAGARR